MFFFFIGGLEQQAKHVLRSGAGRCISCGSPADLVQYQNVLKFFFVPILRWPGKEPLMHCDDCNVFFPRSFSPAPTTVEKQLVKVALRCQSCARGVDAAFKFCPFCGSAM